MVGFWPSASVCLTERLSTSRHCRIGPRLVPDAVCAAPSARVGPQRLADVLAAAPLRQRTLKKRRAAGARVPHPAPIARLANASPISTNADVTSEPPTKIRVGVFILFHS